MSWQKKAMAGGLALAVVLGVLLAWFAWSPGVLPDGFAGSNGRIEATELDVASKHGGRLLEVLVDEGDFVEQGQLLARMDSETLLAQLRQAKAQERQAANAIQTALANVSLRESEKLSTEALIAQRQAELDVTTKRHQRIAALVKRSAMTEQQLDDAVAAMQGARAALNATRAQSHAARAAIAAARSQVIEAESTMEASAAAVARLESEIADCLLKAPINGRVQYRISQPGEVLPPGGKVLNVVDLSDVYMTFFLPTSEAGRVALGAEARLVLDAAPQFVIPAHINYVASVAQFTPKTVETRQEREKLMFRLKARVDPQLLRQHASLVKTGIPGMAYVRLDDDQPWPESLAVRVP
ncbi:TPA: HlyD family efflux transporter periplasmic adaptor subunit [Pseudomonas aeruginosa]|nr:HlyD family efflux transporter periplasmic adaptor subunit [Pseudomonas aeruginosa]